MTSKGLLISFEGLDGAGKTTQIMLLEMRFKERGIRYIATREPGSTELCITIRRLLMSPPENIDPLAEAFLFQADRAQHFAHVVLPALERGDVVITDRCFDSNVVYQGYAKNVDIHFIDQMSTAAMQSRMPDLTILLDITSEEVYKRKSIGKEITRFDKESIEFHRRIREAFLAGARCCPERIKVVDATQSIQDVHQRVVGIVDTLLTRTHCQDTVS